MTTIHPTCSRACYDERSACPTLAPLFDLDDPINQAVYELKYQALRREAAGRDDDDTGEDA